MINNLIRSFLLGLLGSAGVAQSLVGITVTGDIVTMDLAAGTSTVVGSAGLPYCNSSTCIAGSLAMATAPNGDLIFAWRRGTPFSRQTDLYRLDPSNWSVSQIAQGLAASIDALAIDERGMIYAYDTGIRTNFLSLVRIDPAAGYALTAVGSTLPISVQGMTFYGKRLLASGASAGIVEIDPATAAVTVIQPTLPNSSTGWSLTVDPAGRLLACGPEIWEIDPLTGAVGQQLLTGTGGVQGVEPLFGATHYGSGCPSPAGNVPRLRAIGAALSPGQVTLELTSDAPAGLGFFALSSGGRGQQTVLPGCDLLVDPAQLFYLDWFGLDPAGCYRLSFAIPAGFAGAGLNAQGAALDGSGAVSLTRGAEFVVR